jgi:hypothetical protein
VGLRTFTPIAAPVGDIQPGRPVDLDQLPPHARAWAEKQANNDNEMHTVVDGDHCAEFQDDYDVFVVEMR